MTTEPKTHLQKDCWPSPHHTYTYTLWYVKEHYHTDWQPVCRNRSPLPVWREQGGGTAFIFVARLLTSFNPIRTGGGSWSWSWPLQIHVRARWKKLNFSNHKFGKGQYAFHPMRLSRYAEKNVVCQKYHNFISGDPDKLDRRPLWPMKNLKSQSFFGGGSGHPNLMNPFEYDKWLPDKSFPKRIETLTQTKPNPKYRWGQTCPPIFRYAQIGRS